MLNTNRNVLIYESNAFIEEPFLNMTEQLIPYEEADGLLNMAFHPEFSKNGRVYVYYRHQKWKFSH